MTGTVYSGINNIYTVQTGSQNYECRIKGKILKDVSDSYNPIAVGDEVEIEIINEATKQGLIKALKPRRNKLIRWNKKKQRTQTIASNIDYLLIVSSVNEPPFRPRFIDRMLVAASVGEIKAAIVINKIDLGFSPEIEKRLNNYTHLGYEVFKVSATKTIGIKELFSVLIGKTCCFVGQSGVGKTSLLNALVPGLGLKVGKISLKYERGAHTTSFAQLIPTHSFKLIDTPGIRELDLAEVSFDQLRFHFKEFSKLNNDCAFPTCLHLHEPDCAVKKALEKDEVDPDRYESYLRIMADLKEREESRYA